jgi:hypothetical protein
VLQEQLQQQAFPALQVHQQQDDFTPAMPCNMPSAAAGAGAASPAPDVAAAAAAGPSAAAEDLLFESIMEVGLPVEEQPAFGSAKLCDD